ncbi:MAG: error-prone DNA polymerase [Sporichthyaceae bacterium]|nr:error-prone DNA polymerase [Sporichthyaceae bacterium]
MGYNNPPVPWSELERRLSGRRPGGPPFSGDGGDSPAWTSIRPPYDPPVSQRPTPPPPDTVVPYAELHCHSNFSFLDGASHPEELVETAVTLGLHAIALTDHDGLYGVVRLAEAAAAYQVKTIFGAELSLELTRPQAGEADPEGRHLLVLARGTEGYHRLAGAITEGQLAGREKGKPVYDLDRLAEQAGGHWLILTGCRKGLVPHALLDPDGGGPEAAARELDRLVALFGPGNVAVELWDHGYPQDCERNDALFQLATEAGLPVVATNNVHYAAPSRRRLATALAAVRARRSLDGLDGWLPAAGTAHLRTGAEMTERFARYPGAVAATVAYADELAFNLRKASPRLPKLKRPDRHGTDAEWLRALVFERAPAKYGTFDEHPAAYMRLDSELKVIEEKEFPGYFLIVYDIVQKCIDLKILCQGRGSAASSAVCYVLGITAVDAVKYELPFERFIATTREEEPDIDIDIESDRREEIIQYVYDEYGRDKAAQVCNVITYRPKMAVRDMAKALGYSTGQQDAWSKQIDSWGPLVTTEDVPVEVVELAGGLLKFPRHLGIHSGGMVLTDRPVGEVCPIEWARMADRSVLQWDKDDCAAMKLVKFDLLGLGMLSALKYTFDLAREFCGDSLALDTVPKEEKAVYDMLCRADSIGVFQVESRAQMATLPRLRPRKFYDLAIEVALIRPGPIQGGSVHPYIRRKNGQEPITSLHPLLDDVLARTLGVPLFQEQLMQMAMKAGGCSGDDADLLRRAMGSKRGLEKIERLKTKLYDGMARNGITGDLADDIYDKIAAFANFGFAESHSISFALLVYVSSWLKLHYPAAFLAALLRAQPMGFYSPQTLVADGRRHGVEVRGVDINLSATAATLEPVADGAPLPPLVLDCLDQHDEINQDDPEPFDPAAPYDPQAHRRDRGCAVRLGLSSVRTIGTELADRIVAGQPYLSMSDLVRRIGLTAGQLEALASAGAFSCFGLSRREALWTAGAVAQERPDHLDGIHVPVTVPDLPPITPSEQTMIDLWALGVSPDSYPTQHIRASLDELGVVPAAGLLSVEHGRRVLVGGIVTHRQRPSTAGGTTFMNLEDETGLINVIISRAVWERNAKVARGSAALLIRGRLERAEGVVNVIAESLRRLPLSVSRMSRDFH